jgi:hypothetical protein
MRLRSNVIRWKGKRLRKKLKKLLVRLMIRKLKFMKKSRRKRPNSSRSNK